MNRKSVSLASLAISVSAAALLGVSGIAEGDQPGACLEDTPCAAPIDGVDVHGVCGPGAEGCACWVPNPYENGRAVPVPSTQCG